MLRAIALALVSVVAVATSFKPAICAAAPDDASGAEPVQVVLLPARAHAVEVRMLSVEASEEWSSATRANLDAAVQEFVDQSPRFVPVALPELSEEQHAAIHEFVAVANLTSTRFGGLTWFGGPKVYRGAVDRELGPSLAFLKERTGANYAVGAFAYQQEQSKQVATTGAIATVGSAITLWALPPVTTPVTFSYVTLFVADLQTGELRWFNSEKGFEVAGFNFTDLRDPESANKVVQKLFEEYPEGPSSRSKDAESEVASPRPISPMQGGFRIQPPAGWRISDDGDTIRATRDGRALNEMKIELRSHNHAFPSTGQQTTKKASPAQLAEWFIADLQKQDRDELQIIDVSDEEQLAGRPAFRVHFSFRLPTVVGGARIELVAIGAAVPFGLLVAQLHAPQLGYFSKVLPAFEESVRTIELRPRRHLH